jgi:hypothetical protein
MLRIQFKKIIAASLLGALTMFIWGAVSHMVIFIGAGFKPLPGEEKVLSVLKSTINEKGLYFFPGKDFRNTTKEQDVLFESRFRNGPVGLLIYRPHGGNLLDINKLITQFVCTLLSVLIAIFIVSASTTGYWKRVCMVTALGLIACTSVSSIYWNWYEFSASFFVAQILDMVIGFFITGMVICKIIPANTINK